MFCQSCGAQNAVDARFCNMCGTGVTAPTGGATVRGPGKAVTVPPDLGRADTAPAVVSPAGRAPSAPPLGHMPGPYDPGASSVSLHAIGVQSSARTWALIGGIVVLLLLVGGVGGWLTTRGGPTPVAEVPPDAIAAPMEIGTPTAIGEDLPSTEPPPEGMTPTPGAAKRAAKVRTAAAARAERTGTATGTGTSAGTGTSTGTSTRTGTSTGTGTTSTGTSTGTSTRTGTSAGTGTGTGTSAGAGTSTGTSAGAGADTPNTVPLDEPVEERDLLLDLYATQVRRFIRTYYATRAQGCFDHASRNNEGIRGTVVVTFTIAADGSIPSARATRNTTGDDALAGCLVGQVRAWELPNPPGGELELAMPFSR